MLYVHCLSIISMAETGQHPFRSSFQFIFSRNCLAHWGYRKHRTGSQTALTVSLVCIKSSIICTIFLNIYSAMFLKCFVVLCLNGEKLQWIIREFLLMQYDSNLEWRDRFKYSVFVRTIFGHCCDLYIEVFTPKCLCSHF